MARLLAALITVLLWSTVAEAGVTRLQIDRRETVLNGKPFGAAGPYETLIGKVHFALDPSLPQNQGIVDLTLAPYADPDFVGRAEMNTLVYTPVIRALFRALDRWVAESVEPPASRHPLLADGTLTSVAASGWPTIPGYARPTSPMTTYRLDFGPEWSNGIVTIEPPKIGKAFVGLVPAVDEAGNDRAGIRLPEIAVPLATHTGWNYRRPTIGAPDRLASEIGSYLPLPRTRFDRDRTKDGRTSIAERYAGMDSYLGRIALAAVALVDDGFLLAEDVPAVIQRARTHYAWAAQAR